MADNIETDSTKTVTQQNATVKDRLSLPSPSFWKKLGNTCLVIGGAIGVIGGSIAAIPAVPAAVVTGLVVGGTTLAAVGKFLSSITVDWDKVPQENKD